MIAHFCMPAILVPAELFGPHILSIQQHFNLDIEHNGGTLSGKLHLTCANDHDGVGVCH